jgi:aryl-alcohol dehydrogenase-like predicted oxidoreductase
MVPIPGTSSVAHLEENVAAAALQLGHEEFDAVDRVAQRDHDSVHEPR